MLLSRTAYMPFVGSLLVFITSTTGSTPYQWLILGRLHLATGRRCSVLVLGRPIFFMMHVLFLISFSWRLNAVVWCWLLCWEKGAFQDVVGCIYRSSSSSSGSDVFWASFISFSSFACQSGSIWTSGGASAGMATNSRLGSPISLRASHRNGFSKL